MANTAPTFTARSGRVTTDFGGSENGRALALLPDGKMLVAGYTYSNIFGWNFALARYNIDGSLDISFDTDGTLITTGIGTGTQQQAYSMIVQTDGKVIVAGSTQAYLFAIVRYNTDGSLDTSFDVDGKQTGFLGSGYNANGKSVALQSDGKILISGHGDSDFSLARLNPDGSLDTGFNSNGEVSTSFLANATANSIAVQSDGKILLGGGSQNDFTLVRYNSNGSLDASFGVEGKLTTDVRSGFQDQIYSIAVQPDGMILAAGGSSGVATLVRYTAAGVLDTNFNGNGKLVLSNMSFNVAQSLILQSDGKILLGGYGYENNSDFAIVRVNANGSLDNTFSGNGFALINFDANASDVAYSIALQPDGKILLAGTSNDDFALVRLNGDGTVATDFGLLGNTLDASPTFTETPDYSYLSNSYSFIVLDANVQIADGELGAANDYAGATLTLSRNGAANPQDRFAAQSNGSLSTLLEGSYFSVDSITIGLVTANSAGTLKLSFAVGATQSLVNKAMQQITYANTADAPPASVQIDWVFNDGNTSAQGDGGALGVTGNTIVQIVGANDIPKAAGIMSALTTQPGQALSHVIPNGTFTDADGDALTFSVTMSNGTGLPPWLTLNTTTSTFSGTPTAADLGTLNLLIKATDPSGTFASTNFALTVAELNDAPTGTVTISGIVTQGETLTLTDTVADADGLGAKTYQWKANNLVLTGATGTTLLLTEAEVGKTITVTVSYADGNGAPESVTSIATTSVSNVNDLAAVSIAGPAAIGRTLTATATDADGVGGNLTYQWRADGEVISGATAGTFVLTETQLGKAMSVTASFTDGHDTVEVVTSTATALVASLTAAPGGSVTITGTPTQNQILTAANTLTDANGLGEITYQWQAAGKAISGANDSTFTLGEAQVGKLITVTASYIDGDGTPESVSSAATTAVANINDAASVSLSGAANVGRTLTATALDADGLGTVTYAWMADASPIAGATGPTLALTEAQLGAAITVTASFIDGHGTAESVTSSATSVVTTVANTAPSFTARSGRVTTDFGGSENGRALALLPDGKMLVAGYTYISDSGFDFSLARYNANGSLDTSFDTDGKLTTDVSTEFLNIAYSMTVQTDGKFIVAGSSNSAFAVVRYNIDGSLDTSFDVDGKLTGTLGSSNADGKGVILQADGKILISGSNYSNFYLARINPDGSLDTSFDSDGKASTSLLANATANSIAIQADGKILLGGTAQSDFALVRYNTDGSLDTDFGVGGKLTTDVRSGFQDQIYSIVVQADGMILAAGGSGGIASLVRYTAAGVLDTSFNGNGKLVLSNMSFNVAQSLVLQSDGKILLGGTGSYVSNDDFAVTRVNANGSLDSTFANNGTALINFDANTSDIAYAITLQPDGKILLAGTSNGDFALTRLNANGSLDVGFAPLTNTLDASPTFTESYDYSYYFGYDFIVLDANVEIVDGELGAANDYAGATLTLSRNGTANPQDRFAAQSNGSLSSLLEGSYFSVDSITIGRVTANSAGTLKLSFAVGATQSLVNKAMQQITYANTADAPPASVQIDWVFNDGNTSAQGDGGALGVTGNTIVQIVGANDIPKAAGIMSAFTIQPGQALSHVIPNATFTDADGDALTYSVTMSNGTGLPPWLTLNATTGTFSGTPTAADMGTLNLVIKATDPSSTFATTNFVLTVAELNDAPTGTVTISGIVTQGETLTLTDTVADADGLGAKTYQWKANNITLTGATGTTLLLTEAEVGKTITVTVSYADGNGAPESVTSIATASVANVNDLAAVSITGPTAVGRTLTATATDADGVGGNLTYQWRADGEVISGATARTFVLTETQLGKAMSVTASFTDGHGTVEVVTSSATALVTSLTAAPLGTVTITGTPTQNQILTAANTLTDANGLGEITYQWQAAGTAISGANSSSFTLGEAQVGKLVTVTASYTDGDGTPESVSSVATTAVVNINDAASVSLSGAANVGRTLTATALDADGLGTVTYAWMAGASPIAGATGRTLALTEAQLGAAITVTASFIDGHGTAESVTSSATSVVTTVANTAPSFTARSGRVTTDFGGIENGRALALLPDGKMLVAGHTYSSGSQFDFALARYNADGSLDTSFDTDGKLTTNLGRLTSSNDYVFDIAVQSDGKVIVAGGYNGSTAFVRYNIDGSLDTSFDVDGKLTIIWGSQFYAYKASAALQTDGKIIVSGSDYAAGILLARINPDGSLDSSFDSDGKVSTTLSYGATLSTIVVQSDGKILAGGTAELDFALVRYNTNGSLDAGFGINGILKTDIQLGYQETISSIVVQPDGMILAGGQSNGVPVLVRYTAAGVLDTSFNGNGKLLLSNFGFSVAQIVLQSDGKILLGGYGYGNNTDFAVVRVNKNGSLDSTFASNGRVLINFDAGTSDQASAITLQPDGKILLAGTSNNDFAIARLNADGSLDPDFALPANTLDASPTFQESQYGYVILDTNVQIVDGELASVNDYNGATLTLSRNGAANAQDKFSISSGSLSALLEGSYFSVDNITIGRVTINSAGTLKLSFGAGATQNLVNKAMQQITYANTADAPPASVRIDWVFNDGNTGSQGTGSNASVTGFTTVQINATNDGPLVSNQIPAVTTAPNVAFSYVIPATTFNDPDGDALTYSINMSNGSGIPPWLQFNAATRTLSGTPGIDDLAALTIRVNVRDPSSSFTSTTMQLTVAAANTAPTGIVTIDGTARQGQVLTATNNLLDTDGLGTISYQWMASNVIIAGATGSTLALTDAQIGKTIAVTASYLDGRGTQEAVTSAATTAVLNVDGAVQRPGLTYNFIGVLLPDSPNYTVGTGFTSQIYDAEGAQTVIVQAGASLSLAGAIGANTIRLAGNASTWEATHDGSIAILINADGSHVEIPANLVTQTVQFDDLAKSLRIDPGNGVPLVVLGTQTLAEWHS